MEELFDRRSRHHVRMNSMIFNEQIGHDLPRSYTDDASKYIQTQDNVRYLHEVHMNLILTKFMCSYKKRKVQIWESRRFTYVIHQIRCCRIDIRYRETSLLCSTDIRTERRRGSEVQFIRNDSVERFRKLVTWHRYRKDN